MRLTISTATTKDFNLKTIIKVLKTIGRFTDVINTAIRNEGRPLLKTIGHFTDVLADINTVIQ